MSNLTTLLNVNVHNPRICYCVDFLQPLDPYLILLHLQLFGYFPPENTQMSKNTPKNVKYACFSSIWDILHLTEIIYMACALGP